MSLRPYAVGAAAAAVLLTFLAPPAQALPPTTRTVQDAVEPGKAFDIVEISMRSAPKSGRPAVIKVTHGRVIESGDVIDVWFDLDGDKVPDVHLAGFAESEYTVSLAKSFDKDGKDISNDDCVRLSMAGRVSKVKLFPECVDSPLAYAVSVQSSSDGEPATSDDWAPQEEKFTKKVLAAPLS